MGPIFSTGWTYRGGQELVPFADHQDVIRPIAVDDAGVRRCPNRPVENALTGDGELVGREAGEPETLGIIGDKFDGHDGWLLGLVGLK